MEAIQQQARLAHENGLFKSTCAWDVWWHVLYPHGSEGSYRSLARVSQVNYFISHSWSSSKWSKVLQLCHFFNLKKAMTLAGFSCIIGAAIMLWSAGSLDAVTSCQSSIPIILFHLPMGVFIFTYFFGHALSYQSVWFDGTCVNQTNLFEKAAILQAIPAFVANATEIVVLWDGKYFERLWCIYAARTKKRICAWYVNSFKSSSQSSSKSIFEGLSL